MACYDLATFGKSKLKYSMPVLVFLKARAENVIVHFFLEEIGSSGILLPNNLALPGYGNQAMEMCPVVLWLYLSGVIFLKISCSFIFALALTYFLCFGTHFQGLYMVIYRFSICTFVGLPVCYFLNTLCCCTPIIINE